MHSRYVSPGYNIYFFSLRKIGKRNLLNQEKWWEINFKGKIGSKMTMELIGYVQFHKCNVCVFLVFQKLISNL